MSNAIKRINAACIDGRAQSPRYIQQQLLRLHDILVENAKQIRDAIRSDSHHTASEVEVEYYLALQSVKDHYLQLNVERAIKEEYLSLTDGCCGCGLYLANGLHSTLLDYCSRFYCNRCW
jgi:hypothetical protein